MPTPVFCKESLSARPEFGNKKNPCARGIHSMHRVGFDKCLEMAIVFFIPFHSVFVKPSMERNGICRRSAPLVVPQPTRRRRRRWVVVVALQCLMVEVVVAIRFVPVPKRRRRPNIHHHPYRHWRNCMRNRINSVPTPWRVSETSVADSFCRVGIDCAPMTWSRPRRSNTV